MIYTEHQDPGRVAAIALSVAMHGLLILALIFSVKWQTRQESVAVELWSAPPAPVLDAAPVPEPPPEPTSAPRPEPPPPPPVPRPQPKAEIKAPPVKPDIPVQKEKPKPELKKPAPDRSALDELLGMAASETRQIDRRKEVLAEQARAEQQRRSLEGQKQAAAEQARAKANADWQNRIRGKIKGNIIRVEVPGNPRAVFRVEQLPSGEVLTVKMTRSSGNGPYDRAVEAAILKSSPLPLPSDPSLFVRELELTFCPKESDAGCPR